MYKLYKNDVESMIWSLPGTYDIQKREIGDKQYEYNTTFMAKQEVNKKDGTKAVNQFRINAKIDPDGKHDRKVEPECNIGGNHNGYPEGFCIKRFSG